MRILDLHIGKAVVGGALLVICVLLALFIFIEFISEFDRIGQRDYSAWKALQYVLFSVPRLTYELMPLAALLGSLIGLGLLASNNELVIMRAAGISTARISWAAVKAGLLLVIFSAWLGEWVVAPAEEYATQVRSTALSGQESLRTRDGFWTRDGATFVNVRAVLDDDELAGVDIYEFGEGRKLQRISTAKRATWRDGEWWLNDVSRSELGARATRIEHLDELRWESRMSPELLDVIAIKPGSMSISGLWHYVKYLKDNNLSTGRYEIDLWTKIILPVATCVMVFAALPFVFGPLRSVGVGQRMLVGILVGLGFYLLNQIVGYLGLVYGLNPVACAVVPTMLLLAGSLYMMRRVA
jgi:lipopolysaccharide export system permease protein